MLACQDLLRQLQKCAGLSVKDSNADEQFLRALETRLRIDTTSSEQSVDDEDKENNTSVDQTRGKQPQLETVSRGRKEFIAIDEKEFLSVSDLVRGRVKLADVNKVYEVLFQHFKKNKNSSSLTPKEMTKMGLKVTGATGEAKLKVLRALKVIEINNKGAVKMA